MACKICPSIIPSHPGRLWMSYFRSKYWILKKSFWHNLLTRMHGPNSSDILSSACSSSFLSISQWGHKGEFNLIMGLWNSFIIKCFIADAKWPILMSILILLSFFLDVFQLVFALIFLFLFVHLPLSFILSSLNDWKHWFTAILAGKQKQVSPLDRG